MSAGHARRAWVEHLMGTAASIHVVGAACDSAEAPAAGAACFAELREVERVFSPFRDDSDVSRIRRGELAIDAAGPWVGEVARACEEAALATRGMFSAHWRGWFDPTGYVKGWAVERASAHHLAPLLEVPGIVAVGIGVGGDMRLRTAPGSEWTWHVGIADPDHPGEVLATVDVRDGAVATSGTAERGAHIVDPRIGVPASGVRSATVIAPDLTAADVWATAAVVAGRDLSWISGAPVTSGLLVTGDGAVRRWISGVEIAVAAAA
ncbi:MAG: FAD:protein FMN transferase [Microbacterium sp.]|nr:FAD:protein FMN transferase [Microbacterium sp.]